MVELVDRMLELNKQKHSGKLAPSQVERIDREIASTDAEIDNLVYKLYGITNEERVAPGFTSCGKTRPATPCEHEGPGAKTGDGRKLGFDDHVLMKRGGHKARLGVRQQQLPPFWLLHHYRTSRRRKAAAAAPAFPSHPHSTPRCHQQRGSGRLPSP